MDMDDYDGPTVAVLVRRVLSGPPIVDSVHPDEDEAAAWLGRETIAGRAPRGMGWEVHVVPAPLIADPGTQPDVVPAGVLGVGVGDVRLDGELAAVAAIIAEGIHGRPWSELKDQPRGATVTDIARRVLQVVGVTHDAGRRRALANALHMDLDETSGHLPSWSQIYARARRAGQVAYRAGWED